MLDLVLIVACYYIAYRLRFEGEALDQFLPYFTASLPVVLGCKLASLYGSGLYQRSWETFSLRDIAVVLRGVLMGSVLSIMAAAYFYRFEGFSRVVFIMDALLLMIAIVATRASFRSMILVAASRSKRSRRVLVYGAGAFGQLIVREMRANPHWSMDHGRAREGPIECARGDAAQVQGGRSDPEQPVDQRQHRAHDPRGLRDARLSRP